MLFQYRLSHRLRTFYMTNYLLLFRLADLLWTESISKRCMLSCVLLAIMREKERKRTWIDFPLFASGSHLSRFGSSWLSVDVCTASGAVCKGLKCLIKACTWILPVATKTTVCTSLHGFTTQLIKFIIKHALDVNVLMLKMEYLVAQD